MKKPKLVKLTFIEDDQAETNPESWKIKVTGPLGISFTFLVEKMSVSAAAGVSAEQQNPVVRLNLQETIQAKKESAAGWFHSLPARLRTTAIAKKDGTIAWFKSPENIIFLACILIYVFIRLIGLTDYPGYFTFDEANATILASDFVRDGFHNYAGDFWPAFFQNPGGNYNVGSTIVYIQLVTLTIFGRSEYAIRATAVLAGLVGAICVSLALRNIFRVRYWWAGILVLSVIPIWFHISRTEYGVPTFVSFYCAMLYCYWMYRLRNPLYIYPAVIFSALAFYAYSPGQALIPLTLVALLVLDFPYHFRRPLSTFGGAVLGVLCVMPYIRFLIAHSGNSVETLSRVGSYWTQDLPLIEKINEFLGRYLFHLSPEYWFTPAYNDTTYDSILYIMKGYGHLGLWLIPLLAWGLWLLVRRLRETQYRSLLAVFLIAPVGAALVTSPSSITRALVMVIPVALIASIGLDDLLCKVANRFVKPDKTRLVAASLLTVLLFVNSYMLWDVLANGISWFDNNQAGGVQFGASKVFPAINDELKRTPGAHVVISPEWAMMSDLVARIYMGDDANISFASMYDYSHKIVPFEKDTFFVITPEEFEFAKKDPKFSDIQILTTIPYSASKVGFYLIRFKYSPQAQALFAAERVEEEKLINGEITIHGQKVQIAYTRNDGTLVQHAFDDDLGSLYKTAAINPAMFDLTFPEEQEFHSIFIIHGAAPIELQVTFFSSGGDVLKSYTTQFAQNGDKGNTFNFDQTVKASRVKISVKALSADETGTVHIWDIEFNK